MVAAVCVLGLIGCGTAEPTPSARDFLELPPDVEVLVIEGNDLARNIGFVASLNDGAAFAVGVDVPFGEIADEFPELVEHPLVDVIPAVDGDAADGWPSECMPIPPSTSEAPVNLSHRARHRIAARAGVEVARGVVVTFDNGSDAQVNLSVGTAYGAVVDEQQRTVFNGPGGDDALQAVAIPPNSSANVNGLVRLFPCDPAGRERPQAGEIFDLVLHYGSPGGDGRYRLDAGAVLVLAD